MKKITRKQQDNLNQERRDLAIKVVKNTADPNFYLGKREFDRPRKNPIKQSILTSLN